MAPSRSTPNSLECGLLEAQQLSSYLHTWLGQKELPGKGYLSCKGFLGGKCSSHCYQLNLLFCVECIWNKLKKNVYHSFEGDPLLNTQIEEGEEGKLSRKELEITGINR